MNREVNAEVAGKFFGRDRTTANYLYDVAEAAISTRRNIREAYEKIISSLA